MVEAEKVEATASFRGSIVSQTPKVRAFADHPRSSSPSRPCHGDRGTLQRAPATMQRPLPYDRTRSLARASEASAPASGFSLRGNRPKSTGGTHRSGPVAPVASACRCASPNRGWNRRPGSLACFLCAGEGLRRETLVISPSSTSCTTSRSSAFIRSRSSLTRDASRGTFLLRFFVVRLCPPLGSRWISSLSTSSHDHPTPFAVQRCPCFCTQVRALLLELGPSARANTHEHPTALP